MPHCPYLWNSNGDGEQDILIAGLMDLDAVGMRLARALRQLGLGIEQIHLARAAVLHKLDYGFRFGGKMSFAGGEVAIDRNVRRKRPFPP